MWPTGFKAAMQALIKREATMNPMQLPITISTYSHQLKQNAFKFIYGKVG
jgi:hypothetical protein